MDIIKEWIDQKWHIIPEIQAKLFFSILVFVVLWLIRKMANKIVFEKIEDVRDKYHWKNTIKNTYYVLLVLIISALWIDRIGSLATFFGLVTAGLAIALKDLLVNIAGWLFIMIRRPFDVGDRIEIGNFSGDVIDIRFFQFTINEIKNWVDADQSTGRIVHVPNGYVFQHPQASYNQGFSHIWNEIGVMVTFESDWQKAKKILMNIVENQAEDLTDEVKKRLQESTKKYMIFYSSFSPTVYTSVKDSGIMLTMRYLVNPKKRRVSSEGVWEDILIRFKEEESIDLAYPTQRIYFAEKNSED